MDTLDLKTFLYFQHLMLGIKRIHAGDGEEMYFHDHSFSELVIVLKAGKCLHWAEGKSASLKRGDVLLLRQGEIHAYENTDQLEIINLLYDAERLPFPLMDGSTMELLQLAGIHGSRREDNTPELPLAFLDEKALGEVISLADALEEELKQTLPGKNLRCFALFINILVLLGRGGRNTPVSGETDSIELVLAYLNRRFYEKVSAAKLAKIACISERSLFLRFRRLTGYSPQGYRLRKQIEYAALLLKNSRKSLERIASECGFCDANHLSKRFTALMGVPPGAFRRSCRKEKDNLL